MALGENEFSKDTGAIEVEYCEIELSEPILLTWFISDNDIG